jgi:hypothetical protein
VGFSVAAHPEFFLKFNRDDIDRHLSERAGWVSASVTLVSSALSYGLVLSSLAR